MNMLQKTLSELTRAQLLAVLTDEEAVSTDTLRTLTYVGLGGDPKDLGAAAPVAATPAASNGKPAKAAKPSAPKKGAGGKIEIAIDELIKAGVGFAMADLRNVTGATNGRCKTAVKNAVAAGKLFNAGERRFSRYGGTLAAATAAATAARAA